MTDADFAALQARVSALSLVLRHSLSRLIVADALSLEDVRKIKAGTLRSPAAHELLTDTPSQVAGARIAAELKAFWRTLDVD